MFWKIVMYSAIGSVGMAVLDYTTTILTHAITAGRGHLAGLMNVLYDVANLTVLSVAGVALTHDFGMWGYLGVLPILVTAYLVTYHATMIGKEHVVDEEEVAADDERDRKILWLEKQLLAGKAEQ